MMLLPDLILVALFAALGSWALSTVIVFSKSWHGKLSLDHDLNGVQKFHEVPVPRIGGIALFFGMLWALGVSIAYTRVFPAHIELNFAENLMLASLPVFAAGVLEDLTKKISPAIRLGASFASALAASWLLGATLDRLDIWGLDALLGYAPFALAVTAFVVAGGVNAINIIDGFHGFAASAVAVILAGLGWLAWHTGDTLVTHLALVGIGVVIGFLMVNYPTGKIFLGDGGAYFLGFWTSEIAVLLLVRNPEISAWQVLAICAYPVIEIGYSIYRRKFVRNKKASAPDSLHLHTLLYRRIICKKVPYSAAMPWVRNASVASFVVAWTSLVVVLTIVLGDSIAAAATIVLLQVLAYMAIYTRLVRGHWCIHPGIALGLVPASRAR